MSMNQPEPITLTGVQADLGARFARAGERYERIIKVRCPACHGQQTQYSTKSGMRELCPACDGTGLIEREIARPQSKNTQEAYGNE